MCGGDWMYNYMLVRICIYIYIDVDTPSNGTDEP